MTAKSFKNDRREALNAMRKSLQAKGAKLVIKPSKPVEITNLGQSIGKKAKSMKQETKSYPAKDAAKNFADAAEKAANSIEKMNGKPLAETPPTFSKKVEGVPEWWELIRESPRTFDAHAVDLFNEFDLSPTGYILFMGQTFDLRTFKRELGKNQDTRLWRGEVEIAVWKNEKITLVIYND